MQNFFERFMKEECSGMCDQIYLVCPSIDRKNK